MLPLRLPRPPFMQDEMAVLLLLLPATPTPPPLISLPDADPADPAIVLNLRDQRNGLRGMEKARRIFLAAFVAIVEAWAAGMISTCGGGDAVGASVVAVTVLVVVGVACVGSGVFELCSSVAVVFCVGVVALSASFNVSTAAVVVVTVVVVVALALLWVAAASAAVVAAALTALAAAAASSSLCCTFVPILQVELNNSSHKE